MVFHNLSNITIRGAGQGKTIIRRSFNSAQSMIDIGSGTGPVVTNNVVVRDLTIDQNNMGARGYGLAIPWCRNVLVQNVAFINQGPESYAALVVGKFAGGSDNFEANNIRVVNCLFDYSNAPSLDWEVVTVTAGRDVSFEGCRWVGIASNWPGLSVYNTEQFRMINCFVAAAQITYGGRGTYIISGNQFEQALLFVNQAQNTLITGNTFYSFGSTVGLPNGIQFKGGYKTDADPETPWYITADTVFSCENVIVDGNIFKGAKDNAIYAKTTTEAGTRVLDCRDLQITNNKIEGCTNIPIVAFAKYLRIQNNQILDGNTSAIAGNDAHMYIAAEQAIVTDNYAASGTINNHGIVIDVERYLDVIPNMRLYQRGNIMNTSTLARHYNAAGALNTGPTTNVFWQPLTLAGGNGDILVLDALATNNSTLRFRSNGTERAAIFNVGGTNELTLRAQSTVNLVANHLTADVTAVWSLNGLDVAARRISNLAEPTTATDAATKAYVDGGSVKSITARNAAYTLTNTDHTVECDASGGSFQVTLPSAVGRTGRIFAIKKVDSSGNAVTVGTTASQTIDGAGVRSLSAQWDVIIVQANGASWSIISRS